MRRSIFACVAMLAILVQQSFGFGGHITTNTSWTTDVIVTGDVWVDAGVTLTISPGVHVYFPKTDQNADGIGDTRFVVLGALVANGTAAQPVYFMSNETVPAPSDWYGIVDSTYNSTSTSSLFYTNISHAYRGMTIAGYQLSMGYCNILRCGDYGMKVNRNNQLTVSYLSITYCGSYGARFESGTHANMTYSNFVSNGGDGLVVMGTGTRQFNNCRFNSNTLNGVLIDGSTPSFTNSTMRNNRTHGIKVINSANPTITTSSIGSNSFNGAHFNGANGTMTYSVLSDNAGANLALLGNANPTVNYNNILGLIPDTTTILSANSSGVISMTLSARYAYSASGTSSLANFSALRAETPFLVGASLRFYYSGSNMYSPSLSVMNAADQVVATLNPASQNTDYPVTWTTMMSSLKYSAYVSCNYSSSYDYMYPDVSIIRYKKSNGVNTCVVGNTSGFANLRNNYWGTINSVDAKVFQMVANTADYSNFEVASVVSAGSTLSNYSPTFLMTAPSTFTQGQGSVTLRWDAFDVDDNATVRFFYGLRQDSTGTQIGSTFYEDDATTSYNWSLTNVPYGLYYVFGRISDGVNPVRYSYAPAQVLVGSLQISLPDSMYAYPGDTVTVPVSIVNAITQQNILAYQFSLNFDFTKMEALGVSTTGTLSAGWTAPTTNISVPGQISLNCYGTTPLVGAGTLLNIRLRVLPSAVTPSNFALTLANMRLNEGNPIPLIRNGVFSVYQKFTIAGAVSYYTGGQTIRDVRMTMTGTARDSMLTDSLGRYSLIIPRPGTYSFTPSRTLMTETTAISAYDAALTAQAALGLITLSTAQQTAADVSGSSGITAYDAALIAQRAVGIINTFPSNQVWAFTPSVRNYSNVSANALSENYSGIVIGDVSGNWTANMPSQQAPQQLPGNWITMNYQGDASRVLISIPLSSAGSAASFDLALDWATSDWTCETVRTSDQSSILWNQTSDGVKVAKYAVETAQLPVVEFVLQRRNSSISTDGISLRTCSADERAIESWSSTTTPAANLPTVYAIVGNYPNPFNSTTLVRIATPKSGDVSVAIFNAMGQQIAVLHNGSLNAGTHEFAWHAETTASGIYFIQMKWADGSSFRKLTLLR